MGKVEMQKNPYITSLFLALVMWLVLTILHNFPGKQKKEFPPLFDSICKHYKSVQIVANSIGAYFAMSALSDKQIEKAYFIFSCCEHGKANYRYDVLGKYYRG